MSHLLLFSLLVLLQATPVSRWLEVVLMDAENRPIPAQPMRLEILSPTVRQTCQTDAAGTCTFRFESDEEFVRGRVIVPGRGVRPVIWRGPSLTLPISVNANNVLSIPIDFVEEDALNLPYEKRCFFLYALTREHRHSRPLCYSSCSLLYI